MTLRPAHSSPLFFGLLLALSACGGDDGKADPVPADAGHDVTSMQGTDGAVPVGIDASARADGGSLEAGAVDGAGAGANSDASLAPDASFAVPDLASLKTDYAAWQASMDKLRGCGVVSAGVWPFDPRLDLRCGSLCVVSASCADLKTESCDLLPATALEDCYDACSDDELSCGDGSTAPAESVCDLRNDCSNGEDEAHCDTFRCIKGGTVIADLYRCDGSTDCSDGSDEVDCAQVCGKPRVVEL